MGATQLARAYREVAQIARIGGTRLALRFAGAIATEFSEVVRTRTLSPADRRMQQSPDPLRVRIGGDTLTLDAVYFGGMRELYARNVYLRHHDTGVIGPGDTVVDLGCNNGLFTLLAAKHGARVIAVDAQSGFSGPLSAILAANSIVDGRVTFVSALIGGDRGLFRDRAVLTTGSHYADTPTERTMDDLLADVDRVAFLKVDVEGSEFAIFAGALPWLSKVDALTMEAHADFGDPAALLATLRGNGFTAELHPEQYIYARRTTAGVLQSASMA